MTIAFVHPHKAFLPEIAAYQAFFNSHGVDTKILYPAETDMQDIDVEWHFMGRARKPKNPHTVVIHEYTSASTPPLAGVKDLVKKIITPKPSYRIFQNEYVQNTLGFDDNIPFGIRRHAVDIPPIIPNDASKTFDFIYVGTVDKARQLDNLFKLFVSGPLKAHNLLVLSREYQMLQHQLGDPANIRFDGPVAPADVHKYIAKASYGINYIPDIQPYNRQPSGKFLDYAACGIPVITTDYRWIRDFQHQAGGKYYYLKPDLSNFTWDRISQYDYQPPDLTGWTWEEQIRGSGILQFLTDRFPDTHF